MRHLKFRSRAALFALLGASALVLAATPVFAGAGGTGKSAERKLTSAAEGSFEVLEAADQYAEARTAPADSVDAGAFSGAYLAAKSLPLVGGAWSEITTKPYDSDAHGYRDPVWSNSGGGSGIVGGRTTALAADGTTLYAGAADGGVWKRTNGKWTPLTDDAPTLSTGALAVDSSHGLWVGTGEINTSSDSYAGIGVLYKSAKSSTFTRVGGDELNNHTIGDIVFDNGFVLVATNRGLYRHSATPSSEPWTPVLKQGIGLPSTCSALGGSPGVAYISDVAVRPGTGGNTVLAVVGWRAGSNCNGFYLSNDGGQTFNLIKTTGAINDSDLGRTSLAYSADGSSLYALVQSASMLLQSKTDFGGTLLQGIYSAPGGDATASWTKVAEWRQLQNSGSALDGAGNKGYRPGVQAWYNQFLTVDPANAQHVFLGLEEIYESYDGGATWKTAAPYWNFGLPCSTGPQGLDGCPPSAHSDQHAVLIANGTVYAGNDGGVYSRGLNDTSASFASLNTGYNTLQYYYAEAGPVAGGDAIWGGLQDNGVSLLTPGASTMVSPFGGDGTDNIVDHTNGDRAVNAYVDLDMALTTNGGRSDGVTPAYREITPSCFAFTYTPNPCDPAPRFIAPFEADPTSPSHWVAGGRYLWDNQSKGWDTTCGASACDWKIAGDSGAGHSITQVGIANGTWYAAWCGPCNRSGFTRGIITNAGGTAHQLALPSTFPNRFIQGLYVEPGTPSHAYVVFSGFSRRWTSTFSAGEGHVYETNDSGASWTDISGTGATALPDAPGDDIVLTASGKLVVASDIGVFVASAGQGPATTWSRFGVLPNASVNDLALSPDGSYLIAATHGRGLWKLATP